MSNSSSSNASLHPPPLSSFFTIHELLFTCLNLRVGAFSITVFTIISILLLLPLCILVLYQGHQRWRQQQRSGTPMSHSDLFTFHMIITELMNVFGTVLCCCGVHTVLPDMVMLGIYLYSINFFAQMFFHVLTCVERYLAVVQPITYLSLRQAKGIRLRNVTIGCVWFLCFAALGVRSRAYHVLVNIIYFSFLAIAITVVFFCSISVLCVLIRPGPGEGGGDRQGADQSKLRAFYTIMAILGVLLLRFGGNTITTALNYTPQLGENEKCGVWLSELWFSLPSSLVLPLLFLHRKGQLPCCKNNKPGEASD